MGVSTVSDTLVAGTGVGRDFQRGVAALRDVHCRISAGARIAVVGPSGSGKTTLLHILGGLDRPTAGTVEWPGLGRFEELRPRRIGMMFQSPSLFPALTAAENVALPFVLAGEHSAAGNAARMLLQSFGLGEL